jgi:hypothetical protein
LGITVEEIAMRYGKLEIELAGNMFKTWVHDRYNTAVAEESQREDKNWKGFGVWALGVNITPIRKMWRYF